MALFLNTIPHTVEKISQIQGKKIEKRLIKKKITTLFYTHILARFLHIANVKEYLSKKIIHGKTSDCKPKAYTFLYRSNY